MAQSYTKKYDTAPAIQQMGVVDYQTAWSAMKDFTSKRTSRTRDQLWLIQHPPTYTLGVAGKMEHLLYQNGIKVIQTDRGGQITYHGPGQLIAYLLLDLRRLETSVRGLVRKMENAVIELLKDYQINAEGQVNAPGVYVDNAKIAALGLKITKGYCYHGIALNADMDLTPFLAINPCGYHGLKVTQTKNLGIKDGLQTLSNHFTEKLIAHIYNLHTQNNQ